MERLWGQVSGSLGTGSAALEDFPTRLLGLGGLSHEAGLLPLLERSFE